MVARQLTLTAGAVFAAALAGTSAALAEPPPDTPVMLKAFSLYEQGPEHLRRFVFRTRMIYELDVMQVVKAYDAARRAKAAAEGGRETRVVTADKESLIRRPIKELIDELDPHGFWQIHRGTLVNVNAIAGVQRDIGGHLRVRVKGRRETLAVSEPYHGLFRQM
jgi:hypothetical protein